MTNYNIINNISRAVKSSVIARPWLISQVKFWPRSISLVSSQKPLDHLPNYFQKSLFNNKINHKYSTYSPSKMNIKNGETTILESDYETSKLKYTHQNICQALLDRAAENLSTGREKWLVKFFN